MDEGGKKHHLRCHMCSKDRKVIKHQMKCKQVVKMAASTKTEAFECYLQQTGEKRVYWLEDAKADNLFFIR